MASEKARINTIDATPGQQRTARPYHPSCAARVLLLTDMPHTAMKLSRARWLGHLVLVHLDRAEFEII